MASKKKMVTQNGLVIMVEKLKSRKGGGGRRNSLIISSVAQKRFSVVADATRSEPLVRSDEIGRRRGQLLIGWFEIGKLIRPEHNKFPEKFLPPLFYSI